MPRDSKRRSEAMKRREGGHTDEMLERQYLEAPNRAEIDYSIPLAQLISECIELRDALGLSQTQLAERMGTKQPVISRFENLDGRLPSYDFIARLSSALGHSPGMTLHGDFMATVPLPLQGIVKDLAEREGISTRRFLAATLERAVQQAQTRVGNRIAFAFTTQSTVTPSKGEATTVERAFAAVPDHRASEQFAQAV
jgi:transcriptional regulator with XRE-family HTH domain